MDLSLLAFLLITFEASPSTIPDKATAGTESTFAESIHVTASAFQRERGELPYTIASVGGQDNPLRMGRSLPEALGETVGVMVQRTAHGQGSPLLRGFTGFRNLFLVDGIRLNNSVFRDGPNQYWNTVDSFALDRLEVVKGPVSVIYGSDAIGATVQAISARPPALTPGRRLRGNVSYRYASAEHSSIERVALAGSVGSQVRYTFGGTLKAFGDLEAGGDVGKQLHTGYDESDADFRAELDWNESRQLVVGLQHVDLDDAWRTHRTIYGVAWEGTTVGDELRRSLDQRRTLAYVQLHEKSNSPAFDRLSASLSFHRQVEEQYRIRSRKRFDRQGFDVDTLGAWLRLEKDSRLGTVSYGVEAYHDDVGSFLVLLDEDGTVLSRGIQGPVADAARYDTLGVYVQDELPLGRRARMVVGARYNRVQVSADRVLDPLTGQPTSLRDGWTQVVGSLRAQRSVGGGDRWTLFGGVSQGYRAPNLSDLTRLDTARSNELETPSTELEPERYLCYELGLRASTSRARLELSAFYTDIRDLIVSTPTGRVIDGSFEVTKRNSAGGVVQGLELSTQVTLSSRFSLWANAAWLEGEADAFPTSAPVPVREPIDRMMPFTARLALRWSAASERLSIEYLITGAERQDRLSTRDRQDTQRIPPDGTPGYVVHSLRGRWQWRRQVAIDVGLENLTDEDYRVHGSGLNEAGRSLVARIDVGF